MQSLMQISPWQRGRVLGIFLTWAALSAGGFGLAGCGVVSPSQPPAGPSGGFAGDAAGCLAVLIAAGVSGGISGIPSVALAAPACRGLAWDIVQELIKSATTQAAAARTVRHLKP